MKSLFRSTVLSLLGMLARKRLKKLSPKVIGISGSVGKTSTKEAVAHVLSKKFKVLKSDSSYNTDFGIYLTILQEKSGLGSGLSWVKVLARALAKTFTKVTPIDFLILEMGTDQPGDMSVLLDIVVPDIAIMTRISENHLEQGQFPSLESMFSEDVQLQKATSKKKGGLVIMNRADTYQYTYITDYKEEAKLLTYSLQEDVGGEEKVVSAKDGLKFSVQGEEYFAPIVGSWHVEVLLPVLYLAEHVGMNTKEIKEAFSTFHLPAGRMNNIPGIHGVQIIDSSYNASPLAVIKALNLLGKYEARRVFVFGNMNELGAQSDELHEEVGRHIQPNVDLLFTVGYGPRMSANIAIQEGFDQSHVFSFDDPIEASKVYKTLLQSGDVVLVKGSQNRVRLERFIKEIMLHPEDASRLLVRQSPEWNKKK